MVTNLEQPGTHGGPRTPGPGKRSGRPPKKSKQLAELQRLQVEIETTIEAFKKEVQTGFVAGVLEMARAFPTTVRGLIRKANPIDPKTGLVVPEAGDTKVQEFLVSQFTKFFQPEMLRSGGSMPPIRDFVDAVRKELEYAREDDGTAPRVVEGSAVVLDEQPEAPADGRDGDSVL